MTMIYIYMKIFIITYQTQARRGVFTLRSLKNGGYFIF